MKVDAVFEGGGIRGIAFAGAIESMEAHGVQWQKLAGTSVGAIIAALLAAGYTSKEINEQLKVLNFKDLRGKNWVNHIPFVGNFINLVFYLGMYKNDYIDVWLEELLRRKNIRTFADLPPEKLKIIASDISSGQMIIFPDDLNRYGMKPSDVTIAQAVRMSTSIPFFYRPARWKLANKSKAYIVDGGLLSNFPIWLFDVENPRYPTFGFRFLKDRIEGDAIIPTPIHLAQNIVKTMMQAHDMRHLSDETRDRTIQIYTDSITATDFLLTDEQSDYLFESGYQAAELFLSTWDFDAHKQLRSRKKTQK
ncbi:MULTISPECIES: patatin-like phospholipase family protein [Shouchella]|uniref:Patatin-like phospholipase family protein n=2 Tax=Shouchella TaxID=2893057 RepID=A0ABY7W107_9BACI|nr:MULTISPECIES: patatin-like phospholipase family protein [Shouchella]MED4127682.1 patatin-like phospholipase family protein [Shouchella miscanthi]WDF02633.1 patatin-like phospholipase family protein [Shouchella hunanensis]GAF23215.1 LOW QUALITY PROTEIN: lysophospholipase-like family protein [Bacillus sp. JCM 19047]